MLGTSRIEWRMRNSRPREVRDLIPRDDRFFGVDSCVSVAMLRWLFPGNPMNKHDDIRQKRHEGTGTWFFETAEFKRWYDEPSWLFCHGQRTSPTIQLRIALGKANWWR